MKTGKIAALIAGALVAGLVLGTVSSAIAAPSNTTTGTTGFAAICRQAGGTIADIVAKLTGKSVEDVYDARSNGDSFADIAKSGGVSADALADEVLAARKAALDDAVKAGTVTQAQADAMLANMKSRVTSRISSDAPANCTGAGNGAGRGTGGCGGGGGRGGRGMMGGAGCGALGTTAQ